MDQLQEVTNIKAEPTESTSSDRLEIPCEMQVESVKQEDDYLIYSEQDIKMESYENEKQFPVMAGTSYNVCLNDGIKFETDESLIKIESDGQVDELMQDPLDVGNVIKVEKQFSNHLDQGQSRIKTELTDRKNKKNLLETNEDDSYSSGSIQGQDQLLIINANCKDKNYVCSECSKKFNKKSDFDRHFRIHTGEKPYTCGVCEKSFNRKGSLNRHMFIHYDEKLYTCVVCSKVFRHKSTLNDHKLMHSVDKNPLVCNVCNKTFAQKSYLVTHQRIHTGDKPYACEMCDKAFVQKGDLSKHIRIHTGEKPYSCDVCRKSFTRNSTLKHHKNLHNN